MENIYGINVGSCALGSSEIFQNFPDFIYPVAEWPLEHMSCWMNAHQSREKYPWRLLSSCWLCFQKQMFLDKTLGYFACSPPCHCSWAKPHSTYLRKMARTLLWTLESDFSIPLTNYYFHAWAAFWRTQLTTALCLIFLMILLATIHYCLYLSLSSGFIWKST